MPVWVQADPDFPGTPPRLPRRAACRSDVTGADQFPHGETDAAAVFPAALGSEAALALGNF